MKKVLCLILALTMIFAIAACGTGDDSGTPPTNPPPTDPPPTSPPPTDPPPSERQDSFLWNNFVGRDPNNKPEFSTSGANIWWDNWANLRAGSDDNGVLISYRPGAFDPEDFDNEDDYYARASDWMGNWGEAVNMWALDGIAYCKYLTIRMAGAAGGEQNKLILHFQPEDGPSFVARFSDLVLKDGGNPVITTELQDITIDLQASGFPGMTNRMHIRAFAACTILLNEISFHDVAGDMDPDNPLDGFTVSPIGNPADLNIKAFVREADTFLCDDFIGRDPNNKPEFAPSGVNMWWDNWANLRASNENNIMQIEFRPRDFDPEDYDDEDDYFARASDWMGNWGEAINMWAIEGISYCRFLVIRMAGAEGGEENKIMLHFQPEDGPSFVARFSDIVTRGGGNVAITTEMQDIYIDLQASGFPGMTNRMHIRAFAGCTILLDEIYFAGAIAPVVDGDPLSGFTVEAIGNPADLPIKDFVAELS